MAGQQTAADLETVLQLLGDHKHLHRTKASELLSNLLKGDALLQNQIQQVVDSAHKLLIGDAWEQRLGGLNAAKALIDHSHLTSLDHGMILECMRLLEDEEARVRLAVGNCLRSLASKYGAFVYEQVRDRVLSSIYNNYDREGEGSKAQPPSAAGGDLLGSLLQQTYREERPGSGELRHGTEGWRCLETSCRALQQLLEGCGPAAAPHVTPELRELLYRLLHHPNRFVREAAHLSMSSLCGVLAGRQLAEVGAQVAPRLADGLGDSWSQVRYAASVAVRQLLTSIPEHRDMLLPHLIGPMCLNRYYVAEGVRGYSQETWRLVMGGEGRAMCAQHIAPLAAYYVDQSKAANHSAREAACACIAELMEKVDPSAVRPHVEVLLRALLLCFKDLSWPVRDAACTALGRCVLAYPEETSPLRGELLPLWYAHLQDNIPSVREDTAAALANAARAYGQSTTADILRMTAELLPKAQEQPAESSRYGQAERPDRFSATSRQARDQDVAVHSGQEMFSCGSLASRFANTYTVKGDGCMTWAETRATEPWEASDGAVHMMREMSAIAPEGVAPLLPQLAATSRLASFQHAFTLHATIWRALPLIARNVGKQTFKQHLELFLPGLFDDLTCGHQLAEAAAGECVARLRDWLGARILAGRLTEEQRRLLASNSNIPPPAVAGAYPQRTLLYGQPVTAQALLGHLKAPLPTA